MSDSPIEILERWEQFGGTWKVRSLSGDAAMIDLCTCDGAPVDEICSAEPEFVAHVRTRVLGTPS
jgi:hypothetical protein